jgi:hypothetical protein
MAIGRSKYAYKDHKKYAWNNEDVVNHRNARCGVLLRFVVLFNQLFSNIL